MKPKLLFLHEKLGFHGGAEQYIFSVSQEMSQHFDMHLAYEEQSGKRVEEFAEVFSSVQPQNDLKAVLAELQPDLIYMHKCREPEVYRTLIESGLPTVRMVHDHDVYCMRSYKYHPLTRKICTRKAGVGCLFPCMAWLKRDRSPGSCGVSVQSWTRQQELISLDQDLQHHFVGSTYMRDELIRQGYDDEKISIVAPVPRPRPELIASDFSPENRIVFAGQIIRGKGLDCLIKAVSKLELPFHLDVLGEGSHRAHCESLVRDLKLMDKVSFHGFLSHDAMLAHFKHASLVAFPSVWPEPFGAVGLEVMRWGLPVVGFDCGGVSDWLIDGVSGRLVEQRDVPALTRVIGELLKDKGEARRLGLSAHHFVRNHFDFQVVLSKKIERLHSFLSQRTASVK